MENLKSQKIDNQWYMVGKDLKIKVESEEYANVLINVFKNLEITNPNFTPGRRKKK
jgi:hypothetical protein